MDLGAKDQAETQLLKAARAYGIQAGRDDVKHALEDAHGGASFAEWANMHLVYDNLLTIDELALYTALDRSGQVDRLATLHDLAEVQAVSEDDMRDAIGELKRSTDTISKQTETLRMQQAALSRLVKKETENDSRRRELNTSRQRKAETERKRTATQVDELTQNLGFRVSDLEQQGRDAGSSLNETLDGVFSSDDKLLTSLQKLGWELDQPDPEDSQSVEKLRETCMRLIKTTVETVRTRLDTVYLESLVTAERSGRTNPATSDEVTALQEEVDSLYSEILSVAQMSVEQQHLEPALKSMNAQGGQSLHKTAVALTYINECLDYLLGRSGRLQSRIENLKSHQAATESLLSTAKAEMSVRVSPEINSTAAAMLDSPMRKLSPIRMRTNKDSSRSHRRSSGIVEEPPLETLLQSLALSSTSFDEDNAREQIMSLSRALAERSQKYEDVSRSAQESFETSAVAHLDDMKLAMQILHDSVLAESPFGEVCLADPELEASISVLAQEVNKAREKMVAVEGLRGSGKSEKKEELLKRWG